MENYTIFSTPPHRKEKICFATGIFNIYRTGKILSLKIKIQQKEFEQLIFVAVPFMKQTFTGIYTVTEGE